MTLAICLILLVPLGVLIPRLVVRRLSSGLGVIVGAALALVIGFAVVQAVGFSVAALRGTDPVLESESGFNAWKLLIFLAPAAGLHFRRQAAKGPEG